MERQRGYDIGADGERVSANIARLRKARGIDLRSLSEGTRAAGRHLSASALSKLENLHRKIDIDDLFAIATALDVTVYALLGVAENEVAVRVPLVTRGAS